MCLSSQCRMIPNIWRTKLIYQPHHHVPPPHSVFHKSTRHLFLMVLQNTTQNSLITCANPTRPSSEGKVSLCGDYFSISAQYSDKTKLLSAAVLCHFGSMNRHVVVFLCEWCAQLFPFTKDKWQCSTVPVPPPLVGWLHVLHILTCMIDPQR